MKKQKMEPRTTPWRSLYYATPHLRDYSSVVKFPATILAYLEQCTVPQNSVQFQEDQMAT